MTELTREQIDNAWKVMGSSEAGRVARRKLVHVLMDTLPEPVNPSALLAQEGKRILARELLILLDAEATDARSTDASTPRALPGAFSTGSRAGSGAARRRVPIEPPVRV